MKKLNVLDVTLIALFIALTSIGSKLTFAGPIVPFTAQFFFVMMTGVILGAKRAFITQVLYVVLGLLGLPVFATGAGISYVLRPTFGYLIGFTVSATLAGLLTDKIMKKYGKIKFWQMLIVSLIGIAFVYFFGVVYYLIIKNAYLGETVEIGNVLINFVVLFLLTDISWCVLISLISPRLKKAVEPYLTLKR